MAGTLGHTHKVCGLPFNILVRDLGKKNEVFPKRFSVPPTFCLSEILPHLYYLIGEFASGYDWLAILLGLIFSHTLVLELSFYVRYNQVRPSYVESVVLGSLCALYDASSSIYQ